MAEVARRTWSIAISVAYRDRAGVSLHHRPSDIDASLPGHHPLGAVVPCSGATTATAKVMTPQYL